MKSLTISWDRFGITMASRISVFVFVSFLPISQLALSQEPGPSTSNSAVMTMSTEEETRPITPLRELIEEAGQTNPQIAAAYHAWQAGALAGRQAAAFPDTQVFVQHFGVGSPRPFAGYTNSDFAYIGVGVSQDIPFPGKRDLRRATADREADSLHEQIDVARRQVVEQLKLAYVELAYIQQTLAFLNESDRILEQIQQAAESRYRTGGGSQQDMLKAQLQRTRNLQEIAHHHQTEGQLEAQLKELLNRPQNSPDIAAEPLILTPLLQTDEELVAQIQNDNPDLRMRSKMLSQQDAKIDLSYREFLPDFNIGYTYEHNSSKFRDYYMATFSIRFPNRDRQLAALAQAYQDQEKVKQDFLFEEQRIRSEIKQQAVFARASEERLRIYSDGLIPQANTAFQAGLPAYQSGRTDLASLLSSFLDLLTSQMDYKRELADHEAALVRLERLTGATLR